MLTMSYTIVIFLVVLMDTIKQRFGRIGLAGAKYMRGYTHEENCCSLLLMPMFLSAGAFAEEDISLNFHAVFAEPF